VARDDVSTEPTSKIEEAANAGLEAIEAKLNEHGARTDRCFILLAGKGLPEDEANGTTAGVGYHGSTEYEAAVELLAHVLVFAEEAGKAVGLQIKTIPMKGEPGHG
jgi:hypothetical protein